MKKSTIYTVLILICLVLLAGGIWLMTGGTGGIQYANADQYSVGSTAVSATVEELDLHWIAGLVRVEYHDGSEILISEEANKELSDGLRMRWWLDGSTLRIQYAKPGIRLVSNLQKTLTLTLPAEQHFRKAVIESASADLQISDLSADELNLDTTSGDINAVINTKKLTGNTTSGDQNIRQESGLESVNLSSTSGSVQLNLENAHTVSVSSTSGNIALILSGKAETVQIHATSGKVSAVADRITKADISSTSGTVDVAILAFQQLKIDTTSGAVTAKLSDHPGFTCDVRTTSGKFDSGIALEKNGNTYICGDQSGQCSISTTSGNVRIDRAD